MEQMLGMKRKLKQGFSIDELNAGDYSDEDEDELGEDDDLHSMNKDHEGGNGFDEQMEETQFSGEAARDGALFLDNKIDEKIEQWVHEHFEKGHTGGDKVLICCPGCFVALSYLSKPNGVYFEADKVVNCVASPSGDAATHTVSCAECGTKVGNRRKRDGRFLFKDVLPSSTTDQL
jgi:hypothetical protein